MIATVLVTATVALPAGWVVGRLRPRDRLDAWVWDRMTFDTPWSDPWPKQVLLMAALLIVNHRQALDAVRRRNDPLAPPRSPAPVFRSRFLPDPADEEDTPA